MSRKQISTLVILFTFMFATFGQILTTSAQDASAEEALYVGQMMTLASIATTSLGHVGEGIDELQANPAVATDAQWTAIFCGDFIVWRAIYDQAQTIEAPKRFRASHKDFLSGYENLAIAGEYMLTGVVTLDGSQIETGVAYLDEATADIQRGNEKFSEEVDSIGL